jgi:hypothetical protein
MREIPVTAKVSDAAAEQRAEDAEHEGEAHGEGERRSGESLHPKL